MNGLGRSTRAADDQIFVERCLERSRVGEAKYGVGRLDVIGNTEPRLGLRGS